MTEPDRDATACPGAPELDPEFRPLARLLRSLRREAENLPGGSAVRVALEQADGSVSHAAFPLHPEQHPSAGENLRIAERVLKFLLWSRGGHRIYWHGPPALGAALRAHYQNSETGRFDAQIMGERIYERPFELLVTPDLPPEKKTGASLGRHLEGCRIGFDLGGSDRKVAAVQEGRVLFSEEIVWDPIPQKNPQWHFDQIMDSLKRAAAHLPRVDAIGGSAAGVYVNNRVKVASLFRGVPPDLFQSRVKDLFLEMQRAWGGIPFEVANDGEVTALAGSMSLGVNGVLGIAMGTSQAGGYVTPQGTITSWLNELAFVPVDLQPEAPRDEWSGDVGCGALYFSQQCLPRLLPRAGIPREAGESLPESLKRLQALMASGDPRAARVYRTLGAHLAHALALYAEFYEFGHVLLLGRVMSGEGGACLLETARAVLGREYPEVSGALQIHTPDEKEKRHGQAIAAASLPALPQS